MSKGGDFDVRFLKAIASSGAQAESGVFSLVSRMLQYIAEILRKLGPEPRLRYKHRQAYFLKWLSIQARQGK
ncbi:hypothetical protein quinque_004200 [Culex quinquefasciatus]